MKSKNKLVCFFCNLGSPFALLLGDKGGGFIALLCGGRNRLFATSSLGFPA